jgi:threonine aldolase
METIIDLRSDTVTQPTQAMRDAMAKAEVGDDVFGEDPTANRLEALAAHRLGKEAGLFVPSGTMANLSAVLSHCERGAEVILGDRSHTFLYEAGGIAAVGGIHPHTLPNQPDGRLDLDDLNAAIRSENVHFPRSRLICLENTHNACGGRVLKRDYLTAVRALADRHGLKIHLDGARLFNAACAAGTDVTVLAEAADSVGICLSKGLAAPVGSVLCGRASFIHEARRARKLLGGGMRQCGVLAAAGLIALEQMTERLAEDHRHARCLAEDLAALPGIQLDPAAVETNIVFFDLDPAWGDAAALASRLDDQGLKLLALGPQRLRAVTHHGIHRSDIDQAAALFRTVLGR